MNSQFFSLNGGRAARLRPAVLILFCGLFLLLMVAPARATFPGVNGKIVFNSQRTGNDEVFSMNGDGTGQINLTNSTSSDLSPSWSSDGQQIVFTSNRFGDFEVFRMNADGTGLTQLTFNSTDEFDPSWSPDGTQIVYSTNAAGDYEIFKMNANGTSPTQLTFNSWNDFTPVWSPDGSKIAFFGNNNIYVVNADGTGSTPLTNLSGSNAAPDWSPDGSSIVFLSNRDGDNELFVMNADGSNEVQLTNNALADWPTWSPDGTKIAFGSNRDGNVEMYVMNADGSGQTRLTNAAGADNRGDWQPLMGLTIVKSVIGSGAPADWSFSFSGDLGDFSLTDDDPDLTDSDADPGVVAVNEINPAGYATAASCTNGDSATDGNLSVTLNADDAVKCTFTNTICQPGSFDTDATWACAPASPGYFVDMVGASAQTACAPGFYQPNSGATQCIPAEAGYYVPGPAATAQTACAPGFYQPNSGATQCIPAEAGYYVPGPAATAQTACAPGSYQPNSGAAQCIPAEAGYYATGPAATAQTACAPGFYQPNSGAAQCIPAEAGYYAAGPAATAQTACAPGTYQPSSGAAQCIPAEAGYYAAGPAATAQTACAPGSYQPNSGAAQCIPAEAGYYAPGPAAIEQTACPSGTTSPAGSDSADDCVAIPSPVVLLYIAPNRNNGVIDGVAYNDEDIIVNTLGTADWAMYFDGSDVGITKNLTDFTFTPDDCLLMTFNGNQNVPGVGVVKPQDLVKFCPTSTGPTTAGTFTMYFDGSDVGLAAGGEIIDAVEVLPGGDLVISTKAKFNVGLPALKGQKNDLLRFHATSYGPTTAGTWSLYFNNTQVAGLKKENIISLYMDGGDKYVSFWDAYPNVGGVAGNENDILIIHPDNTVTKFWEGSDWGYTGRVHGLHVQ